MRLDGISPLMIEGIYTMLILLWLTLGVVGLLGISNWIDRKIVALQRFLQVLKAAKQMQTELDDKVIEINKRRKA